MREREERDLEKVGPGRSKESTMGGGLVECSWSKYAAEGGNNRQSWRRRFARVFNGLRGG
jgi:hypothetical protein